MIKSMSHACFYVLDQESAKRFYTEKLGFDVRSDVVMGAEFEGEGQGLRWLTVSPPQQPDVARGVVFLQEPAERRTEAVFRDDTGNWSSLNQRAQP